MAGLIPRPFIDELLNHTDLVEFIDGYVPLKKRGTSHTACCPFHQEKTPSFHVITKKQFYHCFGCGASGNAISFAMNYLHQNFAEAVETLATRLGLQVPREGRSEKTQTSQSLYQFLNQVARAYQKNLKTSGQTAIAYLKQRQISGEIAHRFQIGYASPGWQTLESVFKQNKHELIATGMSIVKDDGKTYDRFRQRIMFPIHDRHGRIIGFGGRAIDATQKPKYLNSPETTIFQKSRELYGLHQAIQQGHSPSNILVVEGYMDVIALAQHGLTHVVATLGTATSTYHIQLLIKYTQHIIFCFDGDHAGKQAAWRALENSLPHLNTGLEVSFIFLPEGHDPDSLIREEGHAAFLHRTEQAMPLHRFFIDTLTRDIDVSRLAGKSQLINAAKSHLNNMPDGPYRQLLFHDLARITHMDPHRIHQLIDNRKPLEVEQHPAQHITRTPIRTGMALLLQHPDIYKTCAAHCSPEMLDDQKQGPLKTLMQQIAENPTINTAQLIELWRESPLFDSLTKLAMWDHQVPENALTKEFIDIVLFLSKQTREKHIQYLLEKAHQQSLTTEERLDLQNRLKQRHTSKSLDP